MPEFILDLGTAAPTFNALDSFTQGYLEAAFFTSTNDLYDSADWDSPQAQSDIAEGRCSGDIPSDSSIDDLAPEALVRVVKDCTEFQADNADLLAQAYERDDYSPEQAGRDFWFTRNGHGVGFWDRKQLEAGGLGRALSDFDAATKGEVDMYRGDDSLIYFQ